MRYPDTSLALLAGGQGRRMGGVPKGLLQLHGETFLERLCRLSSSFAETLLVSSDAASHARFPSLRRVEDVLVGQGAPGGVHAALHAARTEWVLVIACDMPCVSEAAVGRLLEERAADIDVACFEASGRLQPLLGLYRRGAAASFEARICRGRSFAELFTALRTRVLPEPVLAAVDPRRLSVFSVNTPEDLRWLEESTQAHAGRARPGGEGETGR